jgi:hypothetical protein
MDKGQDKHIRMFRSVLGILDSNEKTVATIPGLKKAETDLDNIVNDSETHHQGQGNTGEVFTKQKNNARKAVNLSIKKVGNGVVATATSSDDPAIKILKEKHRRTDSEIDKLPEKDVFSTAYLLYADAKPIAAKLAPFVTEAEVDELKENADTFNALRPKKRVQLNKSTTSTRNLEEDVASGNLLIKDTIDLLMAPVEFMDKDFYTMYKYAREIVNLPTGSKKTDSTTTGTSTTSTSTTDTKK